MGNRTILTNMYRTYQDTMVALVCPSHHRRSFTSVRSTLYSTYLEMSEDYSMLFVLLVDWSCLRTRLPWVIQSTVIWWTCSSTEGRVRSRITMSLKRDSWRWEVGQWLRSCSALVSEAERKREYSQREWQERRTSLKSTTSSEPRWSCKSRWRQSSTKQRGSSWRTINPSSSTPHHQVSTVNQQQVKLVKQSSFNSCIRQ